MASENLVSYSIMKALREGGWSILHYHPPGGQAAWGIHVSGELVFLDILAYKSGKVVLAENKGRSNLGDIEKLRKIISNESAVEQVRDFIRHWCAAQGVSCEKDLQFYLLHGYSGNAVPSPLSDINLMHVSLGGILTLTPSAIDPLEI